MGRKEISSRKHPGVFWIEPYSPKTGRKFYIRYMIEGTRHVKMVGTEKGEGMTEAKAAKVRGDMLSQTRLGNFAPVKRGVLTLDKAFSIFTGLMRNSKSWQSDKSRYAAVLGPQFGSMRLDKITPHMIEIFFNDEMPNGAYKSNRGTAYSAQSIHHIRLLLSRIYNRMIQTGKYDGENPVKRVRKLKFDNRIPDEKLTEDQATHFLQALDMYPDRNTANLFRFLFYTGLRKGEAFNLKKSDIDWTAKEARLRDTKAGRTQTAYLNNEAWNILREQVEANPKTEYVFWGKSGGKRTDAKRSWSTIREAANMPPGFRIHGLRHNFAHTLVNSGKVTVFQLKEIMRHRDIKTSERYFNVEREQIQRAADVFQEAMREGGKNE